MTLRTLLAGALPSSASTRGAPRDFDWCGTCRLPSAHQSRTGGCPVAHCSQPCDCSLAELDNRPVATRVALVVTSCLRPPSSSIRHLGISLRGWASSFLSPCHCAQCPSCFERELVAPGVPRGHIRSPPGFPLLDYFVLSSASSASRASAGRQRQLAGTGRSRAVTSRAVTSWAVIVDDIVRS